VPVRTFLRDLEISLATFKRDLEYMRSRLNTPIVWDRDLNGYRYDKAVPVQELPGLWFSDAEIYALQQGMSRKHVKGEKGTPFSRCVNGVAKLRKDQQEV